MGLPGRIEKLWSIIQNLIFQIYENAPPMRRGSHDYRECPEQSEARSVGQGAIKILLDNKVRDPGLRRDDDKWG